MGKLVEGFWDCNYCGTTQIRGSIRECSNCGKARDENTVFYLNKKNIQYVPKAKADKINRNPDWLCKYCGQLSSDNNSSCISCGALRTSENLNYFENNALKELEEEKKIREKLDIEEDFKENFSYDSICEKNDANTQKNNINEKSSSFKNFLSANILAILITIFTLLGFAGFIFLLIPKTQQVTIQELSWQRSIDIQRYQTVQENDWILPSDARLLYYQEEFSHYEDVLDHYDTETRQVAYERIVGYEEYVTGYNDLGNGYFEEVTASRPIYETYYETETYQVPVYTQEAVYRTKYYYEIDKWLYERSVTTTGTDKNPYWGEVSLASDERISSESESYSILGINQKGDEVSIYISYEDWILLEIGQTVNLKVSLGHGEIVE